MNFHLHWLRNDLRRFRLPLTLWVLMVTAYAVFLGWLHLNILTVMPETLRLTRSWTTPLLMMDLFLIPMILASDPAAGTAPFWKTRPPSGFAVAGVKITVVLGFFLLFPVLAWLVMQALCVRPGYGEGGLSLMSGFLRMQAILISACALGAAGTDAGRSAPVKAAQVLMVCFAVFLLARGKFLFPAWSLEWFALSEHLFRGLLWGTTAALALILSCVLFIASRRRRVPFNGIGWAIFLLPPGVVLASSALFPPSIPVPRDESLPALAPAVAEKIRISGPALEYTNPRRTGGGWIAEDASEPVALFRLPLPVEGLPPDSIATGRWLDLKLRSRDGQELGIHPLASRKRADEFQQEKTDTAWIAGCEMAFPLWQLAPFTQGPCSVTGTLRVTVLTRRESVLDMREPGVVENALGRFQFSRLSSVPAFSNEPDETWRRTVPPLISIGRQSGPLPEYSLWHLPSGSRVPLSANAREASSAFIIYTQQNWFFGEPVPGRSRPVTAQSPPLLRETPYADWRLVISWHAPAGTLDIPVTLNNLLLPAPAPGELRRRPGKRKDSAPGGVPPLQNP
ncbi:MAG: hypothetical protein V4726_03720 [Verrucomicrobiota bacterium]